MGIPSQPTTVISLGPRSGQPNSNRSLATEFGDSAPHVLGDFYRGGPLVANHPINSGVPTTIGGPRSLSQYNGASIVYRYTISANTQNLNLFDYATNPARTGTTKSQGYIDNGQYTAGEPAGVEFTINPGVVVGSATRTQNALETGTGWHPSVVITLTNQGTIVGAGGTGGIGGYSGYNFPAQPAAGNPGLSGGTAFSAQRPVTLINQSGTIRAGSGGGGGGAGRYQSLPTFPFPGPPIIVEYPGGGGGGGAGQSGGTGGGSAAIPSPPAPPIPAYFGQPGNFTQGGLGGPAPGSFAGGAGGNAISPTVPGVGQAGTPGVSTPPAPTLGGTGGGVGIAISGNANITYGAPPGTILGPVS